MPSYTYPTARPEGNLTADQIHLLLRNPQLIARRVARLVDEKFLADFLLTGRYDAVGGGIFYDNGETLYADDTPEQIAPGGEYPKTLIQSGLGSAAKTVKWGIETDITDEKIAREGITYVNRGLIRLTNTVVKHVDSVALAVIASKVTATYTSAAWSTVTGVVTALLAAQAVMDTYKIGIDADTIVLKGDQYAKVIGLFTTAGVLPREGNGNPIVNGNYPINLLGFNWVTSPNWTSTDPLLVDRDMLGGMADERLGSPGYFSAGEFGVEGFSQRAKDTDGYEIRARRVVVPVVNEPLAGVKITGTGL